MRGPMRGLRWDYKLMRKDMFGTETGIKRSSYTVNSINLLKINSGQQMGGTHAVSTSSSENIVF